MIKMNLQHDLAMISKQELLESDIIFDEDLDDYHLVLTYLETNERWFDSSIAYEIKYSKTLLSKLPTLTEDERIAFDDIVYRLKNCQPITPYMSRYIWKTSMNQSDFLLKNWNIYHLHLEKAEPKKNFENKSSNLLFFQPEGNTVHLIDIILHPKGNGWFNQGLFETIYSEWPHLLRYQEDLKVIDPVPESEMHRALKHMVTLVPFHNGVLFPTNLGVASSGNSSKAVRTADCLFNCLRAREKEMLDNETEIRTGISEMLKRDITETLEFVLEIENNNFIAYEEKLEIKIELFPIEHCTCLMN